MTKQIVLQRPRRPEQALRRRRLSSVAMAMAVSTVFLAAAPPARADGLLDKLAQKLRPGAAEGDINGALSLPFYFKLVDGPTERGLSGIQGSMVTMPSLSLPFRVAQGLPSADEWVQWSRLAEPMAPTEDDTVKELYDKWRGVVQSLPSKLSGPDVETLALLRAKRLQVFTLADLAATPNDGRRDDASKRYQVIARSMDKSPYFSAVAQADALQRLLAGKIDEKLTFVRQMAADKPAQVRAAQLDAYQGLYGTRYVEPTAAEQLRYSGLLAVLAAPTPADAERVASDYRGKLDATRVAAEEERRQLAPLVSEQSTVDVLKRLIAVDAELQRSMQAWMTRPSSKPGDLYHLLPYCLSQMPPTEVLRRNLKAAAELDRSAGTGTQPALGRLNNAMATVPAELPAGAAAVFASLREQRERLSLAFLHYTAAYVRTERDRPDPALVALYKGWIEKVSALQTPEVWNTCIEWRGAQFKVSDSRWNARSYAPRDVWKPSAVSALLAAQDEASAQQTVQVLRANASSFGDLVASQPAWRMNDQQNRTQAQARLGNALDAFGQMVNDDARQSCEVEREYALRDPNRAGYAPDCEKRFPRR